MLDKADIIFRKQRINFTLFCEVDCIPKVKSQDPRPKMVLELCVDVEKHSDVRTMMCSGCRETRWLHVTVCLCQVIRWTGMLTAVKTFISDKLVASAMRFIEYLPKSTGRRKRNADGNHVYSRTVNTVAGTVDWRTQSCTQSQSLRLQRAKPNSCR
jgi:hypothetical protein